MQDRAAPRDGVFDGSAGAGDRERERVLHGAAGGEPRGEREHAVVELGVVDREGDGNAIVRGIRPVPTQAGAAKPRTGIRSVYGSQAVRGRFAAGYDDATSPTYAGWVRSIGTGKGGEIDAEIWSSQPPKIKGTETPMIDEHYP